jgi:hypothetical protein
MASTITPATLTATVTEAITLNNQPINSSNTIIINSITAVDKRIVLVPHSAEVNLLGFASIIGEGVFIAANVKYIRITNLDDTNFIRIRMSKTSADTYDQKVLPGQSVIWADVALSANSTGASFTTFVNATTILAEADTADVPIEMFIATV